MNSSRVASLLVCLLSTACGSSSGGGGPGTPQVGPGDGGTQVDAGSGTDGGSTDGGQGSGADAGPLPYDGPTLKVGHWNIELFGSPTHGPSNESLQLSNARSVIQRLNAHVWGLMEIMDDAQFEQLRSQLPAYDGFRASDPRVFDGPHFYANDSLQPAFLYRRDSVRVLSAKLLHGIDPGRTPLEVTFSATVGGVTSDYVLIALHLYPFALADSWQRRKASADALKAYLDSHYPNEKVFVVGDWNDDVDTSILEGQPTPFQQLDEDRARYLFATRGLSEAQIGSTTGYTSTIDHHLVSNELVPLFLPDRVRIEKPESYIPDYRATTSDHYPVITEYKPPAPSSPALRVTFPNGGESATGYTTFPVSWYSSGVSLVNVEYSTDGTNWVRIGTDVPASQGTWCWTAPDVTTASARVRVVSATASGVGDTSNGPVSLTVTSATPRVIINEVLASEPSGNTAAEFVEVLNLASAPADLGRWTLSDSQGVIHRFSCGTRLEAGQALAVFGAATGIPAGLRNAVPSSGGNLFLDDAAAGVSLHVVPTYLMDSVSWSTALAPGTSFNRNPDGAAGAPLSAHGTLSTLSSSPGRRADGSTF
jgi:hypothetical protein